MKYQKSTDQGKQPGRDLINGRNKGYGNRSGKGY
ncbi:MAG: hypothetical protein KatS3mg087_0808 [Patescibacteria group bacterium]|nr:MAG: hypothetical protein KatS3mg087_0808 [Patescibacteria group bacterium]